jgi:hypothetical protein
MPMRNCFGWVGATILGLLVPLAWNGWLFRADGTGCPSLKRGEALRIVWVFRAARSLLPLDDCGYTPLLLPNKRKAHLASKYIFHCFG